MTMRNRRGSTILFVLVMTSALVALAASAIVLRSSTGLLGRYRDRQQVLSHGADMALAMTRSRLTRDSTRVPDTGYVQVLANQALRDASGNPLPNMSATTWVGGGGTTGRLATIVAQVRDSAGTSVVRRLDVSQETFAQFAWFSNSETNGTTAMSFGNGDHYVGPVWSNDTIRIASTGATFLGDVATAKTLVGGSYGSFAHGVRQNAAPIPLPSASQLAPLYQSWANSGNFVFNAANSGDETQVAMRIQFVAVDLDGDGDSTDVDEGFFKVHYLTYTSGNSTVGYQYERGDYQTYNCGDWHAVTANGPLKFFPNYIHSSSWAQALWMDGGMSNQQAKTEANKSFDQQMQNPGARCYLGDAPQLVAVERSGLSTYSNADQQKGGDDTTFTVNGNSGYWIKWPGTVDSRLATIRPWDAAYLFPLSSLLNPSTNGVIYVNGTVGVSGVVRGNVTLFATGDIVILDDLRYATDPGDPSSPDMLGLIAGHDIVVADNAMNTPQNIGASYRSLDDSPGLFVHGVLMALGSQFRVQNYASGPTSALTCDGVTVGRGCIYLTGGIIQGVDGFVGAANGTGFRKRYLFDRRVRRLLPPRFPSTHRFLEDHVLDVDAARFDPKTYFARLK